LYSPGLAESDTLRVTITIITFDCDTLNLIEERCSKGAGKDTSFAPHALIFIDDDHMLFQIYVASFCRAHLCTEGLFTILTGYGKIKSNPLPLNHSNPRAAGITGTGVEDRADKLTHPTPCAFLVIDD